MPEDEDTSVVALLMPQMAGADHAPPTRWWVAAVGGPRGGCAGPGG